MGMALASICAETTMETIVMQIVAGRPRSGHSPEYSMLVNNKYTSIMSLSELIALYEYM